MYKNQQNKMIYFSVILAALLLSGCFAQQPVCIKDGKKYCKARGSFTHQWYDYYERGVSCIEGGCYQQALSDLDQSLEKLPEEKRKDEPIVLTYGMHLTNYFPNREKGVTYYHMGDYEAARSAIELSIKESPSAKARQYLDKVRKKIMEREKEAVSIPQINITPPDKPEHTDEIITRNDPLTISGTAVDRQYVSEITVAGQDFYMEGSDQKIEFEKDLKLDDGRYEIDIIAKNLLNGEGKRKITVHVDRSGPVITLESFDPGLGLQGYLYDESGKISLTANGKEVYVPSGKDVSFSMPVEAGTTSVYLLAVDKLGNQTEAHINLETIADSGSRKSQDFGSLKHSKKTGHMNIAENSTYYSFPGSAWECILQGSALRSVPGNPWYTRQSLCNAFPGRAWEREFSYGMRSSPEYPILLAQGLSETATDAGGASFNPRILLTDLTDNKTVYSDLLSVKGEIRGKSNITTVLVNNKPVYTRPGLIVFFNHSVRLDKLGENEIVIRAGDESGRESVKEIIIIREIREILKPGYRIVFKVDPFMYRAEEADAEQGILLQALFLSDLTARDRFQVALRQKLEDSLHEQGFKSNRIITENPDQNSFKSPSFMLLGYIFKIEEKLEIIVKVVDSTTSEIEPIIDAYTELPGRSGLEYLAKVLAEKFHIEFPMAQGKIIRKEGEIYFADMTMKNEERIKWPIVVGSDTEFLCIGNINEILDNGCRIELSDCGENRTIIGKWMATR
ncbi:MAG: hypothetical protein GY795_46870 [Desulfobacterales bacterium]|nr:hypothetical protein [Desulfobacterales bacterium]